MNRRHFIRTSSFGLTAAACGVLDVAQVKTADESNVLMKRRGYSKFVAQGGDWGGAIGDMMAMQHPPELLGIHTDFPQTIPAELAKPLALGAAPPADLSADEKRAYEQIISLRAKQLGYAIESSTRPQTLCALADSPVGLAAWMLDHADGYAQPAAGITSAVVGHSVDGHSAGDLTRDDVLDNITLYWLTNTGVSSAAGGHFAAWEQRQLFSQEVRAGFRPPRANT